MSLRGTPIDNDSFVDVDDISNSYNANNGLFCLTNETNCCSNLETGGAALGKWVFPDGTGVPSIPYNVRSTANDFYRNRGQSVVRLYRQNNPQERGRFSCELLGDTIYVNICE